MDLDSSNEGHHSSRVDDRSREPDDEFWNESANAMHHLLSSGADWVDDNLNLSAREPHLGPDGVGSAGGGGLDSNGGDAAGDVLGSSGGARHAGRGDRVGGGGVGQGAGNGGRGGHGTGRGRGGGGGGGPGGGGGGGGGGGRGGGGGGRGGRGGGGGGGGRGGGGGGGGLVLGRIPWDCERTRGSHFESIAAYERSLGQESSRRVDGEGPEDGVLEDPASFGRGETDGDVNVRDAEEEEDELDNEELVVDGGHLELQAGEREPQSGPVRQTRMRARVTILNGGQPLSEKQNMDKATGHVLSLLCSISRDTLQGPDETSLCSGVRNLMSMVMLGRTPLQTVQSNIFSQSQVPGSLQALSEIASAILEIEIVEAGIHLAYIVCAIQFAAHVQRYVYSSPKQ